MRFDGVDSPDCVCGVEDGSVLADLEPTGVDTIRQPEEAGFESVGCEAGAPAS